MFVDLLAASRRPLQRLLHDCRFSEWENIALFLDSGATEAVRWAGGLGYILSELGISVVVDLQSFVPGRGRAEKAPDSEYITRGIFLVTTFIWDVEGAILNAAKTYGLSEVTVACSVSEEAHACHPHAAQISEDTAGQVSFADISQQLNVSLVRMLKIEAQSSGRTGFRGFSSDASISSPGAMEHPSALQTEGVARDRLRYHDPPSSALVSVLHSPLHMGCFLRCPPSPGGYSVRDEPQKCSAFSLASPACAGTFPLRRCDVGGVGGSGVVELLAAAASVKREGDGISEGRISAEEVPRDERLRYRLLAHVLAEVLWEQLLLDVSGGGGVFTLGDTSRLIGTTLTAAAEEIKRGIKASSVEGSGVGLAGGGSEKRREAAIVLVDRTLDLAAGASHGGSLLQRILSSLPRTGTALNAPTSAAEWSPTASAHQQDVGATLSALTPGLGVPASAIATSPSGGTERSESGDSAARRKGSVEGRWEGEGRKMEEAGDRAGRPRLEAMKALSTFTWPAPPSLCHPDSGAAERVVYGMACLGEEEGQAALVSALERCISDHGCVPPTRKRRGMGLSIMALVTSLARGNPRAGGMTGGQVCFRCRGLVQVALAAMEAHQRTSTQAGCTWPETVAAEHVQRQELRDGGTSLVVMDQLCATLRSAEVGSGSVRRALLLALRGVSLTGGSIGGDEASSFRKAWVSRMLAGGFREEILALPADVREAVERMVDFRRRDAAIGNNTFRERGKEKKCEEEAGVRLELEDIARERIQRLREAAGARSHLITPALRDLAFQPYTFVASAAPETGDGDDDHGGSREGIRHGGDENDGWDDWGEEHEDGHGVVNNAGSPSTEHTMECDTLVGRLAGLMLDRTRANTTVPDLQESKLMSAASVGLGLLSSGLKKFARIGTGRVLGNRKKSRPPDRPVLVIFVVGGFTPLELAEVNGVVRCAASAATSGGLETEIILAGTTISTPGMIYEQIFARPPAGQA